MMREPLFFTFLGILYLLVFAAGAWLVAGTDRRRALMLRAEDWFSGAAKKTGRLHASLAAMPAAALRRSGDAGRQAQAQLRRYRLVILICAILLLTPTLIILLLARDNLYSYEDYPVASDPVVLSLLRGEQLAPPPALPPEVFVTEEVRSEREEVATASREWQLLDADFRQRLLAVYKLMRQHGYEMALLEGYRSPERQEMLAKMGANVTRAGAFQSYHQYGLAADSAFLRNGRIVISEKDPWAMEGYRLFGGYAESAGLIWGGSWTFKDLGHVELRSQKLSNLRKK